MRGYDIIEAFGEIDDRWIVDAKQNQKAAPRWLKWSAVAACLVCVIGAAALSLGRLLQTPSPAGAPLATGVLPPSEISTPQPVGDSIWEPAATPIPEPTPIPTQPPLEESDAQAEDSTLFTSTVYPVSMRFPTAYEEEFYVDVPVEYPGSLPDGQQRYYDNSVFSFVDGNAESYDRLGFVWSILATPLDSYEASPEPETDEPPQALNILPLGAAGGYMYELLYPTPDEQCDTNSYDSVRSYYDHLRTGLTALQNFVAYNRLEENGVWKNIYMEHTFYPAEKYLLNLSQGLEFSSDISYLAIHDPVYDLGIQGPKEIMENIVCNETANRVFTLYEPISASLLGEGGGYVWSISAYTSQEFRETFARSTDFTQEAIAPGTYMLGRSEDYVYVLHHPTDVRYSPDSQESIDAYHAYEDLTQSILETFFVFDERIEPNPYSVFS